MPQSPPGPAWDHECDVIVVGSGAAGMTAAIVAAVRGLSVLLIEKAPVVGGTTALSGGAIWLPDPADAARLGISDSGERVLRYLGAQLGNRMRPDMVRSFLDTGVEMLDFMAQHTHLRTERNRGSPDYEPDLPGGAVAGRRVDALPFDGRLLGTHLRELRPPLPAFMLFGGMMVSAADVNHLLSAHRSPVSFRHAARLLLRHAGDRLRWHRGTRLVIGNALAGRLFRSLLDHRVPYWLSTPAERLVAGERGITGVEAVQDGRRLRIGARLGVVLATGGYAGSPEQRSVRLPEFHATVSPVPTGSAGDGLSMGIEVGGVPGPPSRTGAFWVPCSVHEPPGGTREIYPHFFWDRAKPGLIAVDRSGERFVNEARSYHEFVMSMASANAPGREADAFLVCDAAFIRRWGLGLAKPMGWPRRALLRDSYLVRANSLGELARKLGINAGGLERTVARVNAMAPAGVDEDFGKGDNEYGRALGDPSHSPNPCFGPVTKRPFYAVRVVPGVLGTGAGLLTNVDAQVLDADGHPVSGLYACGNDMESIMAEHYPGPGITLGPALAFGYAAARHLADKWDGTRT